LFKFSKAISGRIFSYLPEVRARCRRGGFFELSMEIRNHISALATACHNIQHFDSGPVTSFTCSWTWMWFSFHHFPFFNLNQQIRAEELSFFLLHFKIAYNFPALEVVDWQRWATKTNCSNYFA